ncbi:hypothetical protein GGP41_005495 [Bipolaris sorokiniana]|uniref:Uncharacterized protein n=1 Tax=Cochliobolus sativus TaxID=45130 RepID=A0A8H5ZG31_COCSA|nr:hypothetical protein GGP41_005495 [Bipolaris sorokiniana]
MELCSSIVVGVGPCLREQTSDSALPEAYYLIYLYLVRAFARGVYNIDYYFSAKRSKNLLGLGNKELGEGVVYKGYIEIVEAVVKVGGTFILDSIDISSRVKLEEKLKKERKIEKTLLVDLYSLENRVEESSNSLIN